MHHKCVKVADAWYCGETASASLEASQCNCCFGLKSPVAFFAGFWSAINWCYRISKWIKASEFMTYRRSIGLVILNSDRLLSLVSNLLVSHWNETNAWSTKVFHSHLDILWHQLIADQKPTKRATGDLSPKQQLHWEAGLSATRN